VFVALVVALEPEPSVTVTSTAPAVPAGEVAVTVVSLTKTTLVAGVVPKFTAVPPVKPLPVIVTFVPPVVGPEFGLTLVTQKLPTGRQGGYDVVVAPPAPTTVAEMPSVCGTWCGMSHTVAAGPMLRFAVVVITAA
jgi:hypothetical protein